MNNKLKEIYNNSLDIADISNIPQDITKYITNIGINCDKKKVSIQY